MSGLTISGGEPFSQIDGIYDLIINYKKLFPNKTIVIYTGYTYEELVAFNNAKVNEILKIADLLIDGRFILSLRDLSLIYRGSSNQRIIDLKATSLKHQIIQKEF